MRHSALMIAASMVVGGALSGCAGNGDGLDENGRPIDSGPLPLAPTFASIQQNVFTPICTQCHAGASAPLGLRLDEASSYAAIVNTASVEVPGLRRIQPGNPDSSYLIQKIEGRAAVGGRMPLNQAALPQATIDVIRAWVTQGAPRPAVATSSSKPATLVAVAPLPDEIIDGGPAEILIASPNAIDTTLLQTGAFTVVRSGGDGSFNEGNEVPVDTLQLSVHSQEPTVLAATNTQAWMPDSYRITIAGNGSLAASDRDGRPIDGDADGQAGGDFVVYFEVGRPL
jgi:hypothetical protein